MDWVRIHVKDLRGPSWAGIADGVRGNWLTLLALCAWEENGGRIVGAGAWTSQQWAAASVTLRKAQAVVAAGLAQWDGEDLMVSRYPIDDEQQCRRNRENGKRRAESLVKPGAGAPAPATPGASTELEEERRVRSPDLFPAAVATGEGKPARKGRKKPPPEKAQAEAMPFTIAQLFATLVQTSGGHFAPDGFTGTTQGPRITAVIRDAAAQGYTLADVSLLGEAMAASWNAGFEVGPSWLATSGKLVSNLAKARRWAAAGRHRSANAAANGSNRVATAIDQGWRYKVNLGLVELEYLRRGITPEWWADPARAQMTEDADGKPLPSPAQIREMCAKEQQAAKERARA